MRNRSEGMGGSGSVTLCQFPSVWGGVGAVGSVGGLVLSSAPSGNFTEWQMMLAEQNRGFCCSSDSTHAYQDRTD